MRLILGLPPAFLEGTPRCRSIRRVTNREHRGQRIDQTMGCARLFKAQVFVGPHRSDQQANRGAVDIPEMRDGPGYPAESIVTVLVHLPRTATAVPRRGAAGSSSQWAEFSPIPAKSSASLRMAPALLGAHFISRSRHKSCPRSAHETTATPLRSPSRQPTFRVCETFRRRPSGSPHRGAGRFRRPRRCVESRAPPPGRGADLFSVDASWVARAWRSTSSASRWTLWEQWTVGAASRDSLTSSCVPDSSFLKAPISVACNGCSKRARRGASWPPHFRRRSAWSRISETEPIPALTAS